MIKTKSFLLLITIFIITFFSEVKAQKQKADSLINIKSFGAQGNGKNDDYPALLAASQFINKRGTGRLVFPPGVYFIKRFRTKTDSSTDIVFKNCNGLKITGNKAKIIINGNFKRGADYIRGKNAFSYTSAITPFFFDNCKDIFLSGFEIDGGVAGMRKDAIAEKGGHLLVFRECENVTVNDMNVHHAQSDGIYIGGGAIISKHIQMTNCTSANNARQGMSVTFLYDGVFKNCSFLNTGITGIYGSHKPATGVDIEPNQAVPKTGKLLFDSCSFINNAGGQFFCTSPLSSTGIVLENCTIVAGSSTFNAQVLLGADNVTVDNCKMNIGNGNLYIADYRKIEGRKIMPGKTITISNCKIESASSGIVTSFRNDNDNVTLTNNSLTFTGNKLVAYFPDLQAKNLTFLNNQIYIPSSAISTRPISSIIKNAGISQGNRFYSEKENMKPKVKYDNTLKVNDN